MNKKNYDGIANEIYYYSEKSDDGRWIIPVEVDWDYTLTKCSDWESGNMELNHEAFPVMKRWAKDYNVGWILNTMRHDEIIQKPIEILKENGITLYGVRKNPLQYDDDGQVTKTFAVMSIDDRNIGIKHKWYKDCNRPYVDWKAVDKVGTPMLEYLCSKLENKQ